jgi:predicted chitinase
MRKYLFLDPLRRAHFFAQIFQETGAVCATVESGDARYFRTMYELLTPQEAADDFDHRQDFLRRVGFLRGRDRAHYVAERPREVHEKAVSLGNVRSGDGFRFRGRGLIHLTGRMYRNKDYAVDPSPDLLMTDAAVAADSAAWYWVSKPLSRHQTNIHRVADAGGGGCKTAEVVLNHDGWHGIQAKIDCGIEDPQTGFHAAAGDCYWAVTTNGKRSLIIDTQGLYRDFDTVSRVVESLRIK